MILLTVCMCPRHVHTGLFKTTMNQDKIVELSKALISIQSETSKARELDAVLDVALAELKEYSVESFECNGIRSALIRNQNRRPSRFRVILNCHLDIVPGKAENYVPHINGNQLKGVGALDMKASAACLILVFKEVAKHVDFPLGLQIVTDEETGGFNGTKYQIDQGVRADFVITGEPTNLEIVNRAKGVLILKVRAQGKSAHGAYPWNGTNAISMMQNFLHKLQQLFPNPTCDKWVTTVNIAKIHTENDSFNKIPDDCTAFFDFRFVPEDRERILSRIRDILPDGFTIEIIADESPVENPVDNGYVKKLSTISAGYLKKPPVVRYANGTSDLRHFTGIGSTGVEFGPVGGEIGGDGEWVDIHSLGTYFEIMTTFLLSLNGLEHI